MQILLQFYAISDIHKAYCLHIQIHVHVYEVQTKFKYMYVF